MGRQYPWYSSSKEGGVKFVPFKKEVAPGENRPYNFCSSGSGGGLSFFSTAAIAIIVVFFLLILWLVIWLTLKKFYGLAALTPEGQNESKDRKRRLETLPPEARGEVGNLFGAARRAFESGNFRAAIIYYFSFLLWELDKHGQIRLHHGKTNHEYSGELARVTELRQIYDQTMLLFEKTYFGDHTIFRADFDPIWANHSYFDSLIAKTKPF